MKYFLIITIAVFGVYTFAHAEITRTLTIGSRGEDVKELQAFLNADPDTRIASSGVGSPGNESTYFGALTAKAVSRLQIKYAIDALTPAGLSTPTGVVGFYTRVLIYKLQWQRTPVVVPPPTVVVAAPVTITSVTPNILTSSPQTITLTGSGFTAHNNTVAIVSDSNESIGSYDSVDGTTITFPFIFATAQKMKSQLAPYKGTAAYAATVDAFAQNLSGDTMSRSNGVTYIRAILKINNSNGESNAVTIHVDIKNLLQ